MSEFAQDWQMYIFSCGFDDFKNKHAQTEKKNPAGFVFFPPLQRSSTSLGHSSSEHKHTRASLPLLTPTPTPTVEWEQYCARWGLQTLQV